MIRRITGAGGVLSGFYDRRHLMIPELLGGLYYIRAAPCRSPACLRTR